MGNISGLAGSLCGISMLCAVAEVLLGDRRGGEIVCRLLAMAGAASMLDVTMHLLD